jgi:hypothetical protein
MRESSIQNERKNTEWTKQTKECKDKEKNKVLKDGG